MSKRTPCEECIYRNYDEHFGLVCSHRASMEGIEAAKAFYTPDEITDDCPYYKDKKWMEAFNDDE